MGSAPCYRPYRLAYRLSGYREKMGTGSEPPAKTTGKRQPARCLSPSRKVLVGNVTVNRWLPGSVPLFTAEFLQSPPDLPPGEVNDVSDSIALPADLPAGEYVLSIAIVDEDANPLLRLAIKGPADDGWYPLSKLRIAKP